MLAGASAGHDDSKAQVQFERQRGIENSTVIGSLRPISDRLGMRHGARRQSYSGSKHWWRGGVWSAGIGIIELVVIGTKRPVHARERFLKYRCHLVAIM